MAKENEEWEKQAASNYWNPQTPGEEIKGVVLKVVDGLYGLQYVIEQADGTEVTTSGHKVLVSRMRNAKKGDMVRITFDGVELPKIRGNQNTKLYSVYILKR